MLESFCRPVCSPTFKIFFGLVKDYFSYRAVVSEDKFCALYLAWWPIVQEVGSSGTSQLKTLIASITEKRDAPKYRKFYEGGILSAFSISGSYLLCLPWPVRLLQHFLAVGQGA